MPGYTLKEVQVKNKTLYSKYKCHSCSLTLRDAVQPSCGHWLCESCIQELFKQDTPVCPKKECGEPLRDDDSDDERAYFPDNFVRREVSNLLIVCEQYERGCPWEGKLKEYEDHLRICSSKVVECSKCGGIKDDGHKSLEGFRYPRVPVGCQACLCDVGRPKAMFGYALKEDQVKNKSLFSKYKCHSCSLTLRDAVQPSCGHWLCESCIQELFKLDAPVCPKRECGEPLRDDDSDDKEAYFRDNFVRREVSNLLIVCEWYERGCSWEGKLKDYEDHLKRCKSKIVECSKCGRLKDDNHQCPEGFEYCSLVSMGCQPSINSFDEDSIGINGSSFCGSEDYAGINRSNVFCDSPEDHQSVNGSNFFCHSTAPASPKTMDEIDSISKNIKAYVILKVIKETIDSIYDGRDFRLFNIENSNYDGRMVWKIPQFSQRMSDAHSGKHTSIFSLPFYTSRYGYKMCLRLYILGYGIGNNIYMSLFFVIMRGEFDNILQWPFTHKVTFRLINQSGNRDVIDTFLPDPTSSSFMKPTSDMNIASGCPRFISHSDLLSKGFVVDDSIFIKCEIDTKSIQVF